MKKSKVDIKTMYANVAIGNRAKDLVSFGRSRGWNLPVLGSAPMPDRPVVINGWLISPAHLDSTPLPKRAKYRMDAVYEAGLRPIGWLIVHEAPKQLTSGIQEKVEIPNRLVTPKTQAFMKSALKTTGTVLGALALASGTALLLVGAIALIVPAFLIAGAVVLDPILVAVTEDGYWVEIDRWDK